MLDQLGIKRKIIPLPFRLNEVNCFVAEGENGYILMDTGIHNQQTKEIWDDFFKEKTLSEILITHLHPDHCGYAGRLQSLIEKASLMKWEGMNRFCFFAPRPPLW